MFSRTKKEPKKERDKPVKLELENSSPLDPNNNPINNCTDNETYCLLLQLALCAGLRDSISFAKTLIHVAQIIRPKDAMNLQAYALIQYQNGEMAEAISTVEQIVLAEPENMMASAILAGFYGITKDARAIALLSKIEKTSSDQTATAVAKALKKSIAKAATPLSLQLGQLQTTPVSKLREFL
jgi:tetratricopeptide (TPR) repeat protein